MCKTVYYIHNENAYPVVGYGHDTSGYRSYFPLVLMDGRVLSRMESWREPRLVMAESEEEALRLYTAREGERIKREAELVDRERYLRQLGFRGAGIKSLVRSNFDLRELSRIPDDDLQQLQGWGEPTVERKTPTPLERLRKIVPYEPQS